MLRKSLLSAALLPLAAACSDATGSEDGRVAVRFNAVTTAGASTQTSASGALFSHVPATGAITLSGSNGTLVLQDIRLIVSELELERANATCVGEDDDACEEFEGGPFLVNLLDGSAATVVNAMIPAGSYTEFEFEVEDLDADEDDDSTERRTIQSILAQMRQAYPSFPSDASMVVHGTFTPTGGAAQPFTVYFDAEIEVEQEFATAFRVPEDGAITVNLMPATWFQTGTQVMNLAALNGRTVEFEAEFESGVEVEKDND